MKRLLKSLATVAFAVVMFTSCEKEIVESTQAENEPKILTATRTEEIKLDEKRFISKKSSFTTKQEFIAGGFVIINGTLLPTTIVGDQRWITLDYQAYISGQAFRNGNTTHHSYDAAMMLNNTSGVNYLPSDIEELSKWRIPSWDDMNHLHHMVFGDEASIVVGLNMKATGMLEYDGTTEVHQNPTYGIFWNSDFNLGEQGQDTWNLFGNSSPTEVFGFQYQLQKPYAPIRLVQTVTPIQN